MVSKFIAVVTFVVLAVLIINIFVSGNTNSLKSESVRTGGTMINNYKEIEKAGTVTTP
ncbi:hypothetical protein [Paenibacillus tyrfis]|uniref:hypothetical protein n=1 Tax=Paenibacillus tyrfis TaxID=1501230 RepID=UPI00209EBB2A|nr:hypothetical protein [Paenibacillus tyrfis]MCP1312081.1 hypothetical protein [Paenibacillus tyrfis]